MVGLGPLGANGSENMGSQTRQSVDFMETWWKRGMLDDAGTTKKEAFAILLAKVEECQQNAC